jgi:hypothetical protein
MSDNKNIAFITLTNSGYIPYTLNCLKSLENIQFKKPLQCYCIGKQGYAILADKGYPCNLIDEEQNSNFQVFRQGNWSNITFNKLKIIYENLLTHDYVCFTDGDIVYENVDFFDYLLENIGDKDVLIQNDAADDSDTRNLCSGFMFIKSNPNTLSLFNPAMAEAHKNHQGWDDQIYINDIKHKLHYKKLPLHLFPTGLYYYKHFSTFQPYLIHFNFCTGHEKQQNMKKYGKWLLD